MYPQSLKFAMEKLSVSKQTYKLIPSKTEGVKNSQFVTVELPQNAIIDLDSLYMSALVTATGTDATAANRYVNLPKYATIISKIVVEIGGVTLHSCTQLEQVAHILASLDSTDEERKRLAIYGEGADRSALGANTGDARRVVVDKFLGFIQTCQPRLIDTGLTNTIKLQIHFAGSEVVVAAGAASSSFTLDDLYFGVTTLAIDDANYYTVYDNYLSGSGNTLNVVYKNLYTNLYSHGSQNINARFSLNSQSLDRLYATWLPRQGVASTLNAVTKTATAFDKDGSDVTSWNFNVNNVQFPMWAATADDAFPLLVNAFGQKDGKCGPEANVVSAAVWKENYWVAAVDFTLPTGVADGVSYVSGVNGITMGLQVAFNGFGTGGASALLLVAECSSILEISSNRVVMCIA